MEKRIPARINRRSVTLPDTEVLLNCTDVAKALRRSVWWIYGLKKAGEELGDPAFAGGVASINDVKAWLKRHPSFSASHQFRKPKRAA